ncbi:hypothetical protein RvY_08719-1 [Ramazzottius varieornatus]|uniref:BZIP domain-containing protein n=1 Tax=Ramazzottius varieornatus TaxID=947166 RepID=A0A1D1VCE7_RAMVA|nr:hypothetical protein RvY_08719-1 [Ramazzottius varieornatus]
MDTDEGIISDYGLWDRTLMEVDLLDTEGYGRPDDAIDFFDSLGGHFVESDPLLPLLNGLVHNGRLLHGQCPDELEHDPLSDFLMAMSKDGALPHERTNDGVKTEGKSASTTKSRSNNLTLGQCITIKSEPTDGDSRIINQYWPTHASSSAGFDSDSSGSSCSGSAPSSARTSQSPSHPGTSKAKASSFHLPPTPPASNDGDSSSSSSPVLSPIIRHSSSSPNTLCLATAISNSLCTSGDGSLLLTEEEKRTLTAEGYPIPVRLPLTKAEERSLKRIRRKIKNKISAQESRRKKKEYIDCLEKKVKNLNEENSELRRKLSASENTYRSLGEQITKYQALLKAAKVQITPIRRVVAVADESS